MENSAIEQEVRQKVSALEEEYQAHMTEFTKANTALDFAEKKLKEAQEKRDRVQQKLSARQAELDGLRGLFTGRRRRELQAAIESDNTLLKGACAEMEAAEAKFASARSALPERPNKREVTYQSAKLYMDAGLYEDAVRTFNEIRAYRDVNAILEKDERLSEAVIAVARDANFAVGKTVTFGRYPQTSAGTDMTPIEWIVLARDDKNALLLSKYALDAKAYNTKDVPITWEECTLRKWLNGAFLKKAFTAKEKTAILLTNVDNSREQGNPKLKRIDGNETKDWVFLLSFRESEKYFETAEASRCATTDYTKEQGGMTSTYKKVEDREIVRWWLRSPCAFQLQSGQWADDQAQTVAYGGGWISENVNYNFICVRPALWVNIESGVF